MKICIVCQKDVEGKPAVPVKEDMIIKGIRTVKQFLHIAANNELYVCEDDIPAQQQRRRGFERDLIFFGVLAAVAVVLFVATSLMFGRFDIMAFIYALVIGFFIIMFAVVFRYAPATEKTPGTISERPKPAQLPAELKELEKAEEIARPKSTTPATAPGTKKAPKVSGRQKR